MGVICSGAFNMGKHSSTLSFINLWIYTKPVKRTIQNCSRLQHSQTGQFSGEYRAC